MARGTGLPLPDSDVILQPAGVTDADRYSTASDWARVAQAGNTLVAIGADALERERHRAQTGYLAAQDLDIARTRTELRDRFAFDPDGFDRAWKGYSDGKIEEAEAWAVTHIQKSLGQEGNNAFSSILNEKRSRDYGNDQKRLAALADFAGNDVVNAAMAGTFATPQGQEKVAKYAAVLDSAVSAGLMSADERELRLSETMARAGAESVVKTIGDTYRDNRAKGVDAGPIALQEAESLILRTEDPRLAALSPEQRQAYYSKATQAVRALESERKVDLAEAKKTKADLEFMMAQGVRPLPETLDSAVEQLSQAGGHADAARLRAAATRFDQIADFAKQPLAEQLRRYEATATGLGADASPEIRAAIAEAAQATGVAQSFLFRTAGKESGFEAAAASDTSTAQGLFQLTDATWKTMLARYGAKYGLGPDTAKTDARASALLGAELARENGDALRAAGLPVTDATLYLAHFAGAEGARKLLNADPAANAAELLPDAAKANRSVFYDGERARTVAEVAGRLTRGFSGEADPRLIAGQRKELAGEAGQEWNKIKADLDAGQRPSPASLATVIRAATLAGEHDLLEDMAARLARFDAAVEASRLPLEAQQGARLELDRMSAQGALQPGQSALLKDLESQIAATQDGLENDPISLGVSRFPELFKAPGPLDLSNPAAAGAGIAERTKIARFVAQNFGKSDIPVLSRADRTAIAGAIAGPDPALAATAFDAIAGLPDDFLMPSLRAREIRDAVGGATRSQDPAKFSLAMTALDKLWARAPQDVHAMLGEDAVRSLQDWQAKLRYFTPEQLADRLKTRDDPQVRERRKLLESQARTEARKKTIDDLVSDLDPGFFAIGPDAPLDARTRDVALADYETLYAERYAETLDAAEANRQAVERMKLYWGRSQVNDGRLTLYAPENYYPAVEGRHDWMREQLAADLTERLGKAPEDFVTVADRITESDLSSGNPPSYLVMARKEDGTIDLVMGAGNRPLRYRWNAEGFQETARDRFARQRSRVQERGYGVSVSDDTGYYPGM